MASRQNPIRPNPFLFPVPFIPILPFGALIESPQRGDKSPSGIRCRILGGGEGDPLRHYTGGTRSAFRSDRCLWECPRCRRSGTLEASFVERWHRWQEVYQRSHVMPSNDRRHMPWHGMVWHGMRVSPVLLLALMSVVRREPAGASAPVPYSTFPACERNATQDGWISFFNGDGRARIGVPHDTAESSAVPQTCEWEEDDNAGFSDDGQCLSLGQACDSYSAGKLACSRGAMYDIVPSGSRRDKRGSARKVLHMMDPCVPCQARWWKSQIEAWRALWRTVLSPRCPHPLQRRLNYGKISTPATTARCKSLESK
ncbi:hypothetical protein MPTK2_8g02870 [Marchantia polymorpha subsp. ruderalis]